MTSGATPADSALALLALAKDYEDLTTKLSEVVADGGKFKVALSELAILVRMTNGSGGEAAAETLSSGHDSILKRLEEDMTRIKQLAAISRNLAAWMTGGPS